MKLLKLFGVLALILSAVPARARMFDDESKKDAKELFEKAKREDSDRVSQVRDLCRAAQMQPKEKKYSDACNSYTAGLNHDDETALTLAISAYQSHDLDTAEAEAKQVSSFDPRMVAKAKTVLDAIHNDPECRAQSVAAIKIRVEPRRLQRRDESVAGHDQPHRQSSRRRLRLRREHVQQLH